MDSQARHADHRSADPTRIPVIWLLGPAVSGQTSIVSALLDRWRSDLRRDLSAATATAETLAWPPEAPRLRFLVTTGLNAEAPEYDPAEDLACLGQGPALILAVLRANEPEPQRLHAVLKQLRAQGVAWPILLVQTDLHALYPAGAPHPLPYPYTADGTPGPAVPAALATALKAQREGLEGLVAGCVPVDFTAPAQRLPPPGYGLTALQAAIGSLAPEIAASLAPPAPPEIGLWSRAILPWAAVAAVADAIPSLAGVPALGAQAMLLRAIARRFGLGADVAIWANAVGVLGTGLVLRSGLLWLLGDLPPLWSMAALAAWTFLASCVMGALAIRFCRGEARGSRPSIPEPGQTRL
ncbi:hypothetical protein [Sediminicoccus sp. KRV36]|uniref:hypothetical protein n=1 Tax=Sediminicoccus sp. KRV36 TaxID=3133721 RepID=UPI0020107E24|nr:hypothetical protein [Sediminicoccus rosea]UPY37419.1 hypothetical protein LHU95_01640 [Sediminicoccus rosea]